MSGERCPHCSEQYDTDFVSECPRCGELVQHCPDCGANVNDDGVSVDGRCCFYCKAD